MGSIHVDMGTPSSPQIIASGPSPVMRSRVLVCLWPYPWCDALSSPCQVTHPIFSLNWECVVSFLWHTEAACPIQITTDIDQVCVWDQVWMCTCLGACSAPPSAPNPTQWASVPAGPPCVPGVSWAVCQPSLCGLCGSQCHCHS